MRLTGGWVDVWGVRVILLAAADRNGVDSIPLSLLVERAAGPTVRHILYADTHTDRTDLPPLPDHLGGCGQTRHEERGRIQPVGRTAAEGEGRRVDGDVTAGHEPPGSDEV